MTDNQSLDISRPGVDLVAVTHWDLATPAEQRDNADALADGWATAPWPDGLISVTCLTSTGPGAEVGLLAGTQARDDPDRPRWRVLTYEQWADERAHRRFRRTGPAPVQYRLYRNHRNTLSQLTGCVVFVTIDFDGPGPERQRRWIDGVLAAFEAEPEPVPGLIAAHFHTSIDGTQVINYAEWSSERAYDEALNRGPDGVTQTELPQWRHVRDFPGVTTNTAARFAVHRTLRAANAEGRNSVTGPLASNEIRWLSHRAHELSTVDATASLTDLEPLREMVGEASIVGVARGTHGARELSTLTHRILRFLVEQLGFRSLAIEEDWTTCIAVDGYLRTGRGDLRAQLDRASPWWRTEEFRDVLCWMRAYNQQHVADPVRLVGLDVVSNPPFGAVADYLRRAAPDRLGELQTHFAALQPEAQSADTAEWYQAQPDKRPIIDHARRAHDLLATLPAGDGHAIAVHHARSIVEFYEFHAIDPVISMNYVETRLAENAIWWRGQSGHKVLYWSGSHSAVGHARTVSFSPAPSKAGRNAGSYLREHCGTGYVSVGLTFHHGSVDSDPTPRIVPDPSPRFAEAVLGCTKRMTYLLDLRTDQPDSVRRWLAAPAKLRLIAPHSDPADDANNMTGGSLAEWFDVIIHTREISPTRRPSVPERPQS